MGVKISLFWFKKEMSADGKISYYSDLIGIKNLWH
jgi:hypothetical protein